MTQLFTVILKNKTKKAPLSYISTEIWSYVVSCPVTLAVLSGTGSKLKRLSDFGPHQAIIFKQNSPLKLMVISVWKTRAQSDISTLGLILQFLHGQKSQLL